MGKIFKDIDWLILIPVIVLGGFSLSILSASGQDLFLPQLFFYLFGLVVFSIFSKIDFSIWKGMAPVIYLLSLGLMLLTFLFPGVRGASRWVEIAGVRWQPSELVKILAALSFAAFFTSYYPRSLKNILSGLIMLLPLLFLIFRQPDLGNAVIMLGIWLGVIYATGLPFILGIIGTIFSLLILPLTWFLLKDYQKSRILSFVNPYFDPAGAGYHSLQAIIAVGSGQWLGRGLGEGSQSRLLFLPEYHTDFIFAALIEDLGFIGGILVILAYLCLLWRILQIARTADNPFASAVLLGIFSQIFLQVFINIGMNLGLVPITGITLPLLSYGGSSIISTMMALGIVANISRERKRARKALDIIG